MKDVVIIGKGPAGISAAVYLKRAGLDIVVIGKGYGALEKSEKIENYYGFEEPITGKELVKRGIRQAQRLGIEILSDEVIGITQEESFEIKTTSNTIKSRTVLLATGKSRAGIDIEGFEELKGKGISFCAVCDGFFYRGKKLAVIGNGDYAASELEELLRFTQDIKVFTNGIALNTNKLPDSIPIIKEKILKINGTEQVTGITTDGGEYALDGIFVAIGTASAADFAIKLGVLTKDNDIIVDENYMTNVEGFYAAGDAVGGFLQISKAVSDGAHASKDIIKRVKQMKKA